MCRLVANRERPACYSGGDLSAVPASWRPSRASDVAPGYRRLPGAHDRDGVAHDDVRVSAHKALSNRRFFGASGTTNLCARITSGTSFRGRDKTCAHTRRRALSPRRSKAFQWAKASLSIIVAPRVFIFLTFIIVYPAHHVRLNHRDECNMRR
jgi:hypothetical protein